MSESNTQVHTTDTETFTTTVHCSLPGDGADVRRPEQFKATFYLIDQEE